MMTQQPSGLYLACKQHNTRWQLLNVYSKFQDTKMRIASDPAAATLQLEDKQRGIP